MTTPTDLDRLRRESPRCLGVAWFTGAPLQLASASGEPAGDAWPSWNTVARLAFIDLANCISMSLSPVSVMRNRSSPVPGS